jgi:hypothetical protein
MVLGVPVAFLNPSCDVLKGGRILIVTICVLVSLMRLPCSVCSYNSSPSNFQLAAEMLPSGELSGFVERAGQQDDWARAPKILQTANSWRNGDPLPLELRRLRKSEMGESGPMDSSTLIAQVSNLPLLAELVVDPGTDPECREYALSQGIRVGGPNRFFNLLRSHLSTAAAKSIQPWVNEVRNRMSRPHAVVDALSISYEDMPRQQALAVLARITTDLRRGVPWPKVYKQYSEEFGYKTGNTTKIGLLGPLVVFPDPALGSGHMATVTYSSGGSQYEVSEWQGTPLPPRLGGLAYFDPAHLPALLKASVGDVISMPSEQNHEYVLYQVREIYKGDAENRPN